MDENLPRPPPDRAAPYGRTRRQSSKMSGISSRRSSKRELVEQQNEDITSPSSVADSMPMDWTDEKHRLFINSMEASFVKRLYNNKTHPVGLLHWNSRIEDLSGSESSRQLNGNNHVCISKKINVEKARPQLDIVHESQVVLKNQWIRRFRSAGNTREVKSTNMRENGVHSSEAIRSGGGGTAPFGVSNSPKKLPTYNCRFCLEDSLDSHACGFMMELEVSDQNFVEENQNGEHLSSPCSSKNEDCGV